MTTVMNARRCVFFWVLTAALCPVCAHAEDPAKPAEESKAEKKDDIWREVSFQIDDDVDINQENVKKVLEILSKSDPEKAKRLNNLQKTNPEQFITEIGQEIHKHLVSKEPPKEKKADSEQPKWEEQLHQKHEEFLQWFEKNYPQEHKELLVLQKENPEKYVQRVIELMEIFEPIQKAEKYYPELAVVMKENLQLQKRRDMLLQQIRIAPQSEHPKLAKDLEQVVSVRFDIIVKEKELQYEFLRKRLERMTARLESQASELDDLKKNKSDSVQKRLDELLERTEKVNWN